MVFMSGTDMILSQNCFLQVRRGITKKIHIQELWLLCSAHCLMMLNICMKFYEHILNGFTVIERTWFCHRNCFLRCSKGRNLKSINTRLQFLHSAFCPMLVNICIKFHEDTLNCFQVTEQARFCDTMDGQTTQAKTMCLPTLKQGDIMKML